LHSVAKVLDVTANMVKNFDEKVVIINPVKEIIAYFKEELKRELTEKDEINLELEKVKAELEEYKSKRKSAKPKEAKLISMPGKQAVQ